MLQAEVKKLKITAENINSVLTKSNSVIKKRKKKSAELEKIIDARSIRRDKESNLEKKSVKGGMFKSSLDGIKKTIISGPMDVMGKVIQFGSMILLGGLLKSLPDILMKSRGIFGKLAEWGKGIAEFFKVIWDSISNFVKAVGENETVKKILKGAGDMFNAIKDQLPTLEDLANKLNSVLKHGPLALFVNDKHFNENKEIDPVIDNEGTRFSETFDTVDDEEIENTIKEWKSLYYVDEDGTVRHKDSGKKAIGARFMGIGTGIDFEDIKKLLDKTRFPSLQSSIKKVDLIGNNSVWGSKTKTIYMPQRVMVEV
tara:strand:- start:1046 stop:1984 length:939 start_codon:yes stop_codon:yes gene_type:complete